MRRKQYAFYFEAQIKKKTYPQGSVRAKAIKRRMPKAAIRTARICLRFGVDLPPNLSTYYIIE